MSLVVKLKKALPIDPRKTKLMSLRKAYEEKLAEVQEFQEANSGVLSAYGTLMSDLAAAADELKFCAREFYEKKDSGQYKLIDDDSLEIVVNVGYERVFDIDALRSELGEDAEKYLKVEVDRKALDKDIAEGIVDESVIEKTYTRGKQKTPAVSIHPKSPKVDE